MFSIPTAVIVLNAVPKSLVASILAIALYLSIGILVRKFEGGKEKSLTRIVCWPWLGNGGRRGKYGWY